METIVTVAFLFVSLALIALILIQHGKGADAGAAFGSGASATVFGAQGAGNFLTRTTAFLATAFFVLSLTLGWFAIHTKTTPALTIEIDEKTTLKVDTNNTKAVIPEIPTSANINNTEAALPEIPTSTTVKMPSENTIEPSIPSILK